VLTNESPPKKSDMEPFNKALDVVTGIMRDGAATHPDNDWIGRSPSIMSARAEEHLRQLHEGDQQQITWRLPLHGC
jgi:hypothetical protein